ncbi:hypothetical protein QVD99_005677 [Batrachochytrium dendrobatidis]|nr:hypothetical protein QVD99_000006 [Batrachochytrium dendrobatidis]KAK5667559.1 hypothetical protein QVD99_005677 [Batrachochytrium dendrobatidis]
MFESKCIVPVTILYLTCIILTRAIVIGSSLLPSRTLKAPSTHLPVPGVPDILPDDLQSIIDLLGDYTNYGQPNFDSFDSNQGPLTKTLISNTEIEPSQNAMLPESTTQPSDKVFNQHHDTLSVHTLSPGMTVIKTIAGISGKNDQDGILHKSDAATPPQPASHKSILRDKTLLFGVISAMGIIATVVLVVAGSVMAKFQWRHWVSVNRINTNPDKSKLRHTQESGVAYPSGLTYDWSDDEVDLGDLGEKRRVSSITHGKSRRDLINDDEWCTQQLYTSDLKVARVDWHTVKATYPNIIDEDESVGSALGSLMDNIIDPWDGVQKQY